MPLPTADTLIEHVVIPASGASAPIGELAREAGIPLWARTGLLVLWAVAAVATSWLAVHVSLAHALRPLRRDPPQSWVERARLAYRGTMVLPLASIATPTIFALLLFLFHGPLSLFDLPRSMGVGFAAGLVGGQLAAARHASVMLGRPVRASAWFRGMLWHWLLFFPGMVVAVPMCFLIPLDPSHPRVVWLSILGAIAILALMRGGALRLLRLAGVLRPATEELDLLCRRAEEAAGLDPGGTGILEVAQANACAHFRPRAMLVTRPMLEALDEEEVLAILHHEAGHLREPDSAITKLRLAGLSSLLIPLSIPLTAGFGWAVLPAFLLVFLIVNGVALNLRREMERRADEAAHEHTEESAVYARALEKLHIANLTPAVLRANVTAHPNLYDRLIAAGVTPDYPRPDVPDTRGAVGSRLLSVPILLAPFLLAVGAQAWAAQRVDHGERHYLETMLSGGKGWVIADLARLRRTTGDHEGALAAARLAVAMEPEVPWWYVDLGWTHLDSLPPDATPEVRAAARAAAQVAFREALEKGHQQQRAADVLAWIEGLYDRGEPGPEREQDLRKTVAALREERIAETLAKLAGLLEELRVSAPQLGPMRQRELEEAVAASREALGL